MSSFKFDSQALEFKPLKDVAHVIMGQSPPSSAYNDERSGLPFFQGKTEFGSLYPTPRKWCSMPTKIAESEDILMSIRAPVGPTNIAIERACIGRGLAAIRPKDGLRVRWLLYAFRAMESKIDSLGTGTTFKAISGDVLRHLEVPIAPLAYQDQAIEELEKQFSRLDEAVTNLQRVKANLKRYKASVLKSAVEGRLVETEATLARREGRTYETGEQLLQRAIDGRSGGGKATRSKAGLAAMPSANLREIPEGWTWTTTGQVCECIVPNRDKPKTFSGDIPWLTLPDFDDSEITVARSRSGLGFTESEVALYRAKAIPTDSVVMSCVGRFGISAVLTRKAVINQQLHAFLPSEGVMPKYLAYVLRTREQEMLEKSTATTIAYLNKENCNSITVPLPPVAEQARIVAEVDRHLSIIREVEAEVDINLQRAQALRQATLSRAFGAGSGQI